MKKYIPTGYQIIDIKIEDDASITVTEDSELLLSLLEKGNRKPVLIHIEDNSNGYNVSGFGVWRGYTLWLSIANANGALSYRFYDDGDSLGVEISDTM